MAFTIDSGKDGAVKISTNSVGEITDWEFEKETLTEQFATSESGGYARATAGSKRGRGTIVGKLDSLAVSTILDGTSATLLLYTNATEKYTVPAIINNFRVKVNIDTGAANSFTATFVTNGAWTEPTLS